MPLARAGHGSDKLHRASGELHSRLGTWQVGNAASTPVTKALHAAALALYSAAAVQARMSTGLLPLQHLRSEVSLSGSLKKGGLHRRQASIPSSPKVLPASQLLNVNALVSWPKLAGLYPGCLQCLQMRLQGGSEHWLLEEDLCCQLARFSACQQLLPRAVYLMQVLAALTGNLHVRQASLSTADAPVDVSFRCALGLSHLRCFA